MLGQFGAFATRAALLGGGALAVHATKRVLSNPTTSTGGQGVMEALMPSHYPKSPYAPYVEPKSIFQTLSFSYNTIGDVPGLPTIAGVSAGVGGAAGLTAGIGLGRLVGKSAGFGAAGAIVGAGAGAIYGLKRGMQITGNFYQNLANMVSERTGVGGPQIDRRSMKVGSGVRNWTRPATGRRLSPNHLGADGSLVLAAHRIRHKSLI
jgi:hypothetical protein